MPSAITCLSKQEPSPLAPHLLMEKAIAFVSYGLFICTQWCLEADSNHRHEDFQSSALPTELSRQVKMAELTGIEPAISGLTGRHVNRYTTAPRTGNMIPDAGLEWWAMTGSNRRPPACKAGALPAELIALIFRNQNAGHRILMFSLSSCFWFLASCFLNGDPYGIRTHVPAVKGRCLRPLDQRAT